MGEDKREFQMSTLAMNPSWFKQVRILFRRSIQEQFRQMRIIVTSIIQTIVIAILIGTVYLKIGNSQQSILRREPSLFFCAVNQGIFGALMVINSFPVERSLSLRERASGTYFASAYFIAKILAETAIQFPVPIIFVSSLTSSLSVSSVLYFSPVSSTFWWAIKSQPVNSSFSPCSCCCARWPRPHWH